MAKSSNSKMKYPECSPISYQKVGPALGSSPSTVNPHSFQNKGKIVKGK